MRFFVNFFLLQICICIGYAQEVSDFITNKNFIAIKSQDATNSIRVYKGYLSKEELLQAIPIIGRTKITNTETRFTPKVPFDWNQAYTAIYNSTIEHFTIELPSDYKHLKVISVYPSSKLVPANILKWYVRFSKPVNEASIYDHLHFITKKGDTLSNATLFLKNPLISEQGKLLTIWVEPGRQKRELKPNQKLGTVFVPEKEYTLAISKTIKDQSGIPMNKSFQNTFMISEADRTKPNIKKWKLLPPKKNTRFHLEIQTNEILDYGSATHSFSILNNRNSRIEGQWELKNQDSSLVFSPNQSWESGTYKIIINPQLEDTAGNNLERLFDQEIHLKSTKKNTATYTLGFEITR